MASKQRGDTRMKTAIRVMTVVLPILLAMALFGSDAHAAVEPSDSMDVLDGVLDQVQMSSLKWQPIISQYASWLFWTLVAVSMSWTFGVMALRKADLAEFFAEFIRFIVFTGFFWWLLNIGPDFAQDIISSLVNVGSDATADPDWYYTVTDMISDGLKIFDAQVDMTKVGETDTNLIRVGIALSLLIALADIGITLALTMISGWVVAYAGVFVLGFGGSRWTSDIAISYYKTALGVGLNLMTTILLTETASAIFKAAEPNLGQMMSLNINDMAKLLILALTLSYLVHRLPSMISRLASQANLGGMSIHHTYQEASQLEHSVRGKALINPGKPPRG